MKSTNLFMVTAMYFSPTLLNTHYGRFKVGNAHVHCIGHMLPQSARAQLKCKGGINRPPDSHPRPLDDLVTARHEGFFMDPNWRNTMPEGDDFKDWLAQYIDG